MSHLSWLSHLGVLGHRFCTVQGEFSQCTPCPFGTLSLWLYSSGRVFGKVHLVPLNCTVQGELWQSIPCPSELYSSGRVLAKHTLSLCVGGAYIVVLPGFGSRLGRPLTSVRHSVQQSQHGLSLWSALLQTVTANKDAVTDSNSYLIFIFNNCLLSCSSDWVSMAPCLCDWIMMFAWLSDGGSAFGCLNDGVIMFVWLSDGGSLFVWVMVVPCLCDWVMVSSCLCGGGSLFVWLSDGFILFVWLVWWWFLVCVTEWWLHHICVACVVVASIAFWHLPPNSAKTGYATEGVLFIHLSFIPLDSNSFGFICAGNMGGYRRNA